MAERLKPSIPEEELVPEHAVLEYTKGALAKSPDYIKAEEKKLEKKEKAEALEQLKELRELRKDEIKKKYEKLHNTLENNPNYKTFKERVESQKFTIEQVNEFGFPLIEEIDNLIDRAMKLELADIVNDLRNFKKEKFGELIDQRLQKNKI